MEYFGLSLEEEKSRLIEFRRFAEVNCKRRGQKPETFFWVLHTTVPIIGMVNSE